MEKALVKSAAIYTYTERLNKSFIIQAGQNCFVKENVFGTDPIRRLTLCMVKISLFRSTPLNHSPFTCQKLSLERVELQRGNGFSLAATPLNIIKLDDFEDNHFFLVFNLTSTEEASKSLTLFPELTGSKMTLKLYFSKALDDAIELFLIGERFSQIFIESSRNVSKNTLIDE